MAQSVAPRARAHDRSTLPGSAIQYGLLPCDACVAFQERSRASRALVARDWVDPGDATNAPSRRVK